MESESGVKEIRLLVAEIVENAKSGHPGGAMGIANTMHILYSKILNVSPNKSKWINRDIFIMSNGHCCAILYVCLYLKGFIKMEDLLSLRKIGSKTPGHPEFGKWIEATTGPLGQGVAQAVGYAVALKSMMKYNKPTIKKLFTNRVYCMVGDGCLQEGIAQEALSLAGHLKLNNLTVIYDYNRITIDGDLSLSNSEDAAKKMRSMGFSVVEVADSEDSEKIEELLRRKMDRPVFMIVHTVIGYDTSNKNTCKVHGSVLGAEEIRKLKNKYSIPEDKHFSEYITEDTKLLYSMKNKEVDAQYEGWIKSLNTTYKDSYPNEYSEITSSWFDSIDEIEERVMKYLETAANSSTTESKSTREISGEILNELAQNDYRIFGGSADLSESTCAILTGETSKPFTQENRTGNYLHYGIREHAMFGIMNGISAYGYHRVFGGTFLNFITYGFPAIRIAAISGLSVCIIGTHDSIFLGGDGPTHQPIETLALLRATPNIVTFRPANRMETATALIYSMYKGRGPCVIALTRQRLNNVQGGTVCDVLRGGYIISDYKDGTDMKLVVKRGMIRVLLIATGSEVSLAMACKEILKEYSIRVVSMVSFELFEEQDIKYRKSILADCDVSISIEALSRFGWSRYSNYQIGLDLFGESGSPEDVCKHFGFTPEDVAMRIRRIVS